jgi:membrane protein DedA with SNARE-associated domain
MNELLHIIHGWIVSAGALGVFGASLAEELVSIIPSAAVQTASGAFMMSGFSWSFASFVRLITAVVIPASLGVMIGSLPYVYLSRRYGKTVINRWGKYIGVHNSDIDNIAQKMEKSSWDDVLFILARAFPVIPSIALAIYAGIVRMSLSRYVITTMIGVAIRATIFGIVGWLFASWVSSLENISSMIEQVGIGILVLIIIWVFWKVYKKTFYKK